MFFWKENFRLFDFSLSSGEWSCFFGLVFFVKNFFVRSLNQNFSYRGSWVFQFVFQYEKRVFCKNEKTYSTHDSRVVPHHSTRWAQPCLTSEFGWDPVYPRWYDRMMQIQLFHSTHSLLKLFRLHFFTSRLNFYRTHFSQQPLPTHLTTTSEFGLFLLLNYSLVRHDFSLLYHSTSFFNFLYPTTSTSFRFFRSEFNGVQSEFDSERFQDIIETFQKTFGGVPSWTPAEFSQTLTEFDPNIGTTLTYVTSTR